MATLILSCTNLKDPKNVSPIMRENFTDEMVQLIESDIISTVIYRQGRDNTICKSNGVIIKEVWNG